MGRAFAEVCRFVGCLPSELYKKHDPTIGDFHLIAALHKIEAEEEAEMLKAMGGGGGTGKKLSSGRGPIVPHVPYRRGGR
jgi:hypothetical protein